MKWVLPNYNMIISVTLRINQSSWLSMLRSLILDIHIPGCSYEGGKLKSLKLALSDPYSTYTGQSTLRKIKLVVQKHSTLIAEEIVIQDAPINKSWCRKATYSC